jgi:hypothetical protein
LDWNYFDTHRHELLSLVPASAIELHKLLGLPAAKGEAIAPLDLQDIPERWRFAF